MSVQFLPSLLSWPLHAFYLFSFLPQGHSLALSRLLQPLTIFGEHKDLPISLLRLLLKALMFPGELSLLFHQLPASPPPVLQHCNETQLKSMNK